MKRPHMARSDLKPTLLSPRPQTTRTLNKRLPPGDSFEITGAYTRRDAAKDLHPVHLRQFYLKVKQKGKRKNKQVAS